MMSPGGDYAIPPGTRPALQRQDFRKFHRASQGCTWCLPLVTIPVCPHGLHLEVHQPRRWYWSLRRRLWGWSGPNARPSSYHSQNPSPLVRPCFHEEFLHGFPKPLELPARWLGVLWPPQQRYYNRSPVRSLAGRLTAGMPAERTAVKWAVWPLV